MAVIQKTTQPCYRVEKKISENIFLDISTVKPFLQKEFDKWSAKTVFNGK